MIKKSIPYQADSAPQAHDARSALRIEDHQLFFAHTTNGKSVHIDEEEARHAALVLRLSVGDIIDVTDGAGGLYQCSIAAINKRGIDASVLSKTMAVLPKPYLHLFVGLPDKDPFERLLEELPPLGISSITPLVCEYCQRPWWEKSWEKAIPRFQRKLEVAIKQSKNPWLPVLNAPLTLENSLSMTKGFCLLADQEGIPIQQSLANINDCYSCFIGPPGGFSPTEMTQIKEKASAIVQIGPYRLRTELAATILCGMVCNSAWPR